MEMYFHFVSDFRVLRSSTNSVLKVRHAVNKAWCRCLYKKMSLVHRFVACLLACLLFRDSLRVSCKSAAHVCHCPRRPRGLCLHCRIWKSLQNTYNSQWTCGRNVKVVKSCGQFEHYWLQITSESIQLAHTAQNRIRPSLQQQQFC